MYSTTIIPANYYFWISRRSNRQLFFWLEGNGKILDTKCHIILNIWTASYSISRPLSLRLSLSLPNLILCSLSTFASEKPLWILLDFMKSLPMFLNLSMACVKDTSKVTPWLFSASLPLITLIATLSSFPLELEFCRIAPLILSSPESRSLQYFCEIQP